MTGAGDLEDVQAVRAYGFQPRGEYQRCLAFLVGAYDDYRRVGKRSGYAWEVDPSALCGLARFMAGKAGAS